MMDKKKEALYTTWRGMMQRCYDPNQKSYKDYGGRGITVCEDWKIYENYKKYIHLNLGEKPSPQHTIDRPDNNGHYEPGNIRWATRSEQVHNRRMFHNNKSGYRGVSWHKGVGKWVAQARVSGVKKHLGYFETKDEAARTYQRVVVGYSK